MYYIGTYLQLKRTVMAEGMRAYIIHAIQSTTCPRRRPLAQPPSELCLNSQAWNRPDRRRRSPPTAFPSVSPSYTHSHIYILHTRRIPGRGHCYRGSINHRRAGHVEYIQPPPQLLLLLFLGNNNKNNYYYTNKMCSYTCVRL